MTLSSHRHLSHTGERAAPTHGEAAHSLFFCGSPTQPGLGCCINNTSHSIASTTPNKRHPPLLSDCDPGLRKMEVDTSCQGLVRRACGATQERHIGGRAKDK